MDRLRGIELVGGLISEDHVFADHQTAVVAAHEIANGKVDW